MPVTKELRSLLHQALLDAYTTSSLEQMLFFHLGEDLEEIAGGKNLSEIAFNLLHWAERTGRLTELIEKARVDNPGNLALQGAEKQLQEDADVPTSAPPTEPPQKQSPAPSRMPRSRMWSISGILIIGIILATFLLPGQIPSEGPSPISTDASLTVLPPSNEESSTPNPTSTPTETSPPEVIATSTPIIISTPIPLPLTIGLAASMPCVEQAELEGIKADLESLNNDSERELIVQIMSGEIKTESDLPSSEQYDVVIWSECLAEERVAYHAEFLQFKEGKGLEQAVAELDAIQLTAAEDEREWINVVLVASVAYHASWPEWSAKELDRLKPQWQALDDAQEQAAVGFLLGNSWFWHNQRLADKAIIEFESVLKISEQIGQAQSSMIAMLYNNLGMSYLLNTKFNAARDAFSQAIAIDNSYVMAHINRSSSYLQLGELEAAETDCENADIQSGLSNYSPAYLCRAKLYYQQENMMEKALRYAEKSIEFSMETPDYWAYFIAGFAHYEAGDRSNAIHRLKQSIQVATNSQLQELSEDVLSDILTESNE